VTHAEALTHAAEQHALQARAALADEAEGLFRDHVAALLAVATELDALVSSW
jgi:hypothetical protein